MDTMLRGLTAQLVGAVVFLCSRGGAAAEVSLTLDQALTLARERGPAALAARGRVEEARGRRTGAGILLRENPEVEVLGGRRRAEAGSSTDLEIGVTQVLELGGRRGSRIRGANAGVEQELAAAEETLRQLQRDVAVSFFRLLHADERLRIVTASGLVAEELLRTAQRRYQAGDIADLDLNLAKSAVARARSEAKQAEAQRSRAEGQLKRLLGLGVADDLKPRGDLRARRQFRLEELRANATERPDLRALLAEGRDADAQVELGKGYGWPDLGLRFEVHQEAEEDVILGGVSLRLPLFERGQELRATGRARKRRVNLEATSRRSAIAVEVETAFEVHAKLGEAAEGYEKEVLAILDDNETLARKSFDAGQIGVGDYLLIRREILDGRRAYLDQLLELAIAGAELEASAGVPR